MKAPRNLRLLTKVVETGSFSAAGRVLGLSPASVSRQINALEAEMGVRLFYRTSRKLTVTEAGHLFYDRALELLDRFNELDSMLAEHQSNPRGLLHVHTRTAVGLQFLARALPQFQERYPDITVKLLLTEDPRDLIEHKIDVAIRLGNLEEPSLAVRKLWDASPRILFASRAYLDRHPPIRKPEDLLDHNCLTYLDGRYDDGYATWRFRTSEGTRELRVHGTLQVNNSEVLRQSVLAGAGIALLPVWCLGDAFTDGRLVQVLPGYSVTPVNTFDHSIYVVYEKSRQVPPKVHAFVNFLLAFFRGRQVEALSDSMLPPPPADPAGSTKARDQYAPN